MVIRFITLEPFTRTWKAPRFVQTLIVSFAVRAFAMVREPFAVSISSDADVPVAVRDSSKPTVVSPLFARDVSPVVTLFVFHNLNC